MDTEVSSCGRRNRGRLSYSSGGEPEIGKIFDTEGGPVQAQQRVQQMQQRQQLRQQGLLQSSKEDQSTLAPY